METRDVNTDYIMSSWNGNTPAVKWFIENGVDVEANNGDAMIRACAMGKLPTVKCLFKSGCSTQVYNGVAILVAAARGHLNIVRFLNGVGGAPNGLGPILVWAAEHNQEEVVKWVIKKSKQNIPMAKEAVKAANDKAYHALARVISNAARVDFFQ